MDTLEKIKEKHAAKMSKEIAEFQIAQKYCKLPGFKHVITCYNLIAVFEVENIGDISTLLHEIPATELSSSIKFASKPEINIYTPYKITNTSPARHSKYTPACTEIKYKSGDIEIWIKFPIEILADYYHVSTRKITSSEYHYFPGMSYKQMEDISIPVYMWPHGMCVSYCGGNQVLKAALYADEIIAFLMEA